MSDSPEMPESKVARAVQSLRHTTQLLHQFGIMVVFASGINIGVLLFCILRISPFDSRFLGNVVFASAVPIASGAIVFGSALMFERSKKRGDALFVELSDELQWYVRTTARELNT